MEAVQAKTDAGARTVRVTIDTSYYNDNYTLSYYPPGVHYSQGRDVSVDGNKVSVVIDGKTFSGTNFNTGPITSYWALKSMNVEPKLSTTHESLANPRVESIGLTYKLDETGMKTIYLSWTRTQQKKEKFRGFEEFDSKDHTRQDDEGGSDIDYDKLERHNKKMAPPNWYRTTCEGRMVVNQVYHPRDPTTNNSYPY
jgi:hypothetical protein